MRLTARTLEVALSLLEKPADQHYGYDLCMKTQLRSGVLYPILQRMLNEGWLTDGWETPAPEGRPARRYYEVTPEGVSALGAMRAKAAADANLRRHYPEVGRYA